MKEKCVVGLDIGGTHARIGAVSMAGALLHSHIYHSRAIADGAACDAISDLAAFIHTYLNDYQIDGVQAIAIAFPGTLDQKREILYSASNLGENAQCRYDGMNIPAELSRHFDVPVFLGKDSDFILYNDIHQLGIDTQEMVTGIYFGTGIGSSFYYRGETIYGSDGVAGEIGHLPISDAGRKCTCNETNGCCETVASGWRLIQIKDEFFPQTPMEKLFVRHSSEAPLATFVYDCARVIGLTVNLLNSAYTVIGGGIVNMPGFPREKLLHNVLRILRHPHPRDNFQMLFSPGGQNAGILGAAQLIFRKLSQNTARPF